MHSTLVKFLALAFICVIDGVLCQEDWKRQSQTDGSGSEPTMTATSGTTGPAGGLSAGNIIAIAVGTIVVILGIVATIPAIIAIIAGVYKFRKWWKNRGNERTLTPKLKKYENGAEREAVIEPSSEATTTTTIKGTAATAVTDDPQNDEQKNQRVQTDASNAIPISEKGSDGTNHADGTESCEYQKLQKYLDTVIDHLGDVVSAEGLADKLFGKKLITKDVLNKTSLPSLTNTDKIRVLIRAVLTLVKIEPSNYHKFLQTLSAVSGAEGIVKLLKL